MNDEIDKIIGELAGAASMCWEPKPTGVFAPDEAIKFVEEAKQAIEAYISKQYILREDVNTIIKASESVNAQYHGRDDCKSCGLAEALKLKLNLGDK